VARSRARLTGPGIHLSTRAIKFIVDATDLVPDMIKALYDKMAAEFGPLEDWWPAVSDFERISGAILVQQTRWENVDRVLRELERRDLMSPEAISRLPIEELEEIVRPAGFYRNKARSLQGIARYLTDNPDAFSMSASELRRELLTLRGIGDETADVLVLYVAGQPSFVVDAYARRTLKCLGIEGDYRQLQKRFHECLPADAGLYRHYHALLVEHGKRYCNKKACANCVVKGLLH
jgi:endonuclease-3 related protein